MENNERANYKEVLDKMLREYALKVLSKTSRPFPTGLVESVKCGGSGILSDLEEQKFVKRNNLTMKVIILTEEGNIKIPLSIYNLLIIEVLQELCDEGFLTKDGNRYSLIASSDEMAAKAYHAQQDNVKTKSTFHKVGNVVILGALIVVFTLYMSGFQFYEGGYWFGDGEVQPWNIPGLSPARGISGEWSGSYDIDENMKVPAWGLEGGAILDIKQNGNDITGSYTMENYRSRSITGTISSSRIDFTDGFVRFSGSFTTDLMTLNVESCSMGNYCYNPEYTDKIITEPGDEIPGMYDGEPGIRGTIKLMKGSNNLQANFNSYNNMPDPNAPLGNYPEGFDP